MIDTRTNEQQKANWPGEAEIPLFAANGSLNYGWLFGIGFSEASPKSYLSVFGDRLEITGAHLKHRIRLSRDDIAKVSLSFFGSLRIIHQDESVRPHVVFRSPFNDLLFEEVQKVGYPVELGTLFIPGAVFGFSAGACLSFVLALLFMTRNLPFLKSATVLSAGESVSTERFASFAGLLFLIGGLVFLSAALMSMLSRRRHGLR